MKLPIRVQVMKNFKGRIMCYTASLGNWAAEGLTKADAEAKLAEKIERFANEDGHALIRVDTVGDVWMTMRYNGGEWGHGRWFRDERPGFEGRMLSAGCTFGSEEQNDRVLAIDYMDRHLDSLRTGEPMKDAA